MGRRLQSSISQANTRASKPSIASRDKNQACTVAMLTEYELTVDGVSRSDEDKEHEQDEHKLLQWRHHFMRC